MSAVTVSLSYVCAVQQFMAKAPRPSGVILRGAASGNGRTTMFASAVASSLLEKKRCVT